MFQFLILLNILIVSDRISFESYLDSATPNFYEQVATIRPVLKLLKDYKLVVIGDREYRSTAFALWLTTAGATLRGEKQVRKGIE